MSARGRDRDVRNDESSLRKRACGLEEVDEEGDDGMDIDLSVVIVGGGGDRKEYVIVEPRMWGVGRRTRCAVFNLATRATTQ